MSTCFLCGPKMPKGYTNMPFHRFPSDPETRAAWFHFCNLIEGVDVVTYIKLCTHHFRDEDYVGLPSPGVKRQRLRPKAVPSIKAPPTTQSSAASMPSTVGCKTAPSQPITADRACITAEIKEIEHAASITLEDKPTHFTISCKEDNHLYNKIVDSSVTEPHVSAIATSEMEAAVWPSTPKKRKCMEPRYINEIRTPDVATPRRAKRVLALVKKVNMKKTQQIHRLQQQRWYLKKKINSLQDLIDHLKSQGRITENAADAILDLMPQSMKELMHRKLKNTKRQYSPEVRSFALTLNFYSPKAYNYVRKHWQKLLPHPATLREWYKVIDGRPGFTKEALHAIKLRTLSAENVIVNLVFDEMALREQLIYSKGTFSGGIDVGTTTEENHDSDGVQLANNAFVLMAVAINQHWKIPIGYFVVRSLSSGEKASILKQAFHLLNEAGAKVYSITFDGLSSNISMCRALGANLTYGPEFKPYFINPASNEFCFIFIDLCHVMKLIRNCLGDKEELKVGDEVILWLYIQRLELIQRQEGLRAANKLTQKHINYRNHIMNVKLAFQTLSESVSKSLLFMLQVEATNDQFKGCEATSEFCRNMNNIADMLNCKNRFSKGQYNCPLTRANYSVLKQYALTFQHYIEKLEDKNGVQLLHTNRQTGVLGVIINLQNMFRLFDKLEQLGLQYLLTYKLSQDYLETFFSAIRSRGGFNNNPNVVQFRAAYRRLLIRHEVKELENGNCLFDGIDILHVSSHKGNVPCSLGLEDQDQVAVDLDHNYISAFSRLSEYVEHVVEYIAGYVTAKLKDRLQCRICADQLIHDNNTFPILCHIKNRGAFVPPSRDVISICKTAESFIRQNVSCFGNGIMKKQILLKIIAAAHAAFNNSKMHEHITQQTLLDNHKFQLVEVVASTYLNIRFHHEAKKASLKPDSVRRKLSKIILFRHE